MFGKAISYKTMPVMGKCKIGHSKLHSIARNSDEWINQLIIFLEGYVLCLNHLRIVLKLRILFATNQSRWGTCSLSAFRLSDDKTKCCGWTAIFLWRREVVSEKASVCKVCLVLLQRFLKLEFYYHFQMSKLLTFLIASTRLYWLTSKK